MPTSLTNNYTGTNIFFNEYTVSFNTEPNPGSVIFIGLDYDTHQVLAEFNGEVVVVGILPISYFSPSSPFRLVLSLNVSGTNNSFIPYQVIFDFSEDGMINGSVDRNPFISVLPRPSITLTLSDYIFDDNQDMTIEWSSDCIDHVELIITNVDDTIVYSDFSAPASGTYVFNGLSINAFASKNGYTVTATAFNEPLISSTVDDNFSLIVTDKYIFPDTVNNINTISNDSTITLDLLPLILTTNLNQMDGKTVDFVYTTENATSVDILTMFGQGGLSLQPNGTFTFTNLSINTTYSVTIIARDDEGNLDVRNLLFELNDDGLNSDKGILGLKRGRDMTFSVSAGVYTKETDLSGIAEPFVGTNGCFAGKFRWGPCLERIRIANEETLGVYFGTPGTYTDNAIDFFTAASYLSYSSALDVVRLASYNGSTYLNKNAKVVVKYNGLLDSGSVVASTPESDITILNDEHYTNMLDGDLENNTFIARYTGELGNSIGVGIAVNSATVATGDEFKYSVDFIAKYDADNVANAKYNKDLFSFSRDKKVYYVRSETENTARSIFDLGDWIVVNGAKYAVKGITLGSESSVQTITVDNGGTGYTTAPTVTITNVAPGTGTGATATATLATTGAVKAVTIDNPGSGYTASTTGTLTFTGGNPTTPATGTVTTDGAGAITSVSITTAGVGYKTAPTVTFSGIGSGTGGQLSATIGFAVASITVTNGGSGYTEGVTIGFTGNGTGALATGSVETVDTIELDRLYSGTVSTGNYKISSTLENPSITELTKLWRFSNVVGLEPSSESLHVVIFDSLGKITGTAGSLLEKFVNVSFDSVAKNLDGTSNYWLNRINTSSVYVRIGTMDISGIPLVKASTDTNALGKNWISNTILMTGGDDAFTSMGIDDDIAGYDLFKNPEETDAPIIIGNYRSIKDESGTPNAVLANYLLQNIAETRRDSVVFLSCRRESVVNNPRNEVREILKDVNDLPSTSYGEMDSGWKYMYDRYNDRYLWVPTAGDHAGCYARTDRLRDPWYSAAGEQRGILNNVIKLAFNPNETQRDQLYANRVNPIVSFPSVGTMVYGDKTLLSLSSSFNRIPTRRLFIVIEKTLANAARFALFEFNDSATRTQVYGIVDAYLRNVKAGRGIEDYAIDVSEKVNTPEVVALNQFKGRIYIKPKYSINFIELNFINVGAILSFDEAIAILNNTI